MGYSLLISKQLILTVAYAVAFSKRFADPLSARKVVRRHILETNKKKTSATARKKIVPQAIKRRSLVRVS